MRPRPPSPHFPYTTLFRSSFQQRRATGKAADAKKVKYWLLTHAKWRRCVQASEFTRLTKDRRCESPEFRRLRERCAAQTKTPALLAPASFAFVPVRSLRGCGAARESEAGDS